MSMILVSFFSEGDVLSDEINIGYIENQAFCFFGDTLYKLVTLLSFTNILLMSEAICRRHYTEIWNACKGIIPGGPIKTVDFQDFASDQQ